MGQALRNGSIEADPRKTDRSYCEWCDFRAACRFDETAGDKVRWLKNIKDKEFWEQLGGDDNAGSGHLISRPRSTTAAVHCWFRRQPARARQPC